MLKLAKYLKPFIGYIIAAVFFLFAQGMSELTLPDYMSRIVNNGIQQGGIVSAVPEALRKSQMDKLTIFMSEEEKTEVLNNYTLIDEASSDYESYKKKYPKLKDEPIYVLNDLNTQAKDDMNHIMGKAFIAVSGIEKLKLGTKDGIISFNGMDIPADTDLYALFKNLPPEQVAEITKAMEAQVMELGDDMTIQMAAPLIKSEYEILGINTARIQTNYIMRIGTYMLLLSLLVAVCTVMVGFLSSRTAAGVARNLRSDIFKKVQNFSNVEFDKFSTASLITRTTNDVNQIQMVIISMIRMVFFAPVMGIGGVIKALEKSISMSWIIALAVILLLGLIFIVFSIVMPKFKLIQKLIDKLNQVARENLSGIMVIRAFNTQKFEEERFDKANRELTDVSLFVNRIMVSMMPIMTIVMNGVTLLIIWIGAHQIEQSSMQVGDMMAFIQYAMQIIFSFLTLSMMFIMLPRASVSAERIAEVLETEPSITDPDKVKSFERNKKGVVEFKNVYFKYSGADDYALKDINFTALPGQTTAFIGPTGSGKTTLINLILRFYDVTEGQVLVDGVDVRDMKQHELRDKIGYVPQKASLFKGTIKSNLKYGDEKAADQDIEKAAQVAQATEFIEQKSEKFEAPISQGGTNVSGGQKQRLSIARALVKKPQIYIFDDSFSALDFKTDAKLRKALKEYTGDSTVLIVAQRISTILNADQIIVLDEGRIVGKGTHRELMENCPTYKEIALSQFSEEELA